MDRFSRQQSNKATGTLNDTTEQLNLIDIFRILHPEKAQNAQESEINLTKDVKDLLAEKYKTLVKDIEDGSKKWKDIPCSWIRRIHTDKISIVPKATYRFKAISIKISMTFLTKLDQIILKFI